MMNIVSSGAQTTVISTKHSLLSTSSSGVYVLLVDTANMALGDVVELTIDVAYSSGGTRRQTYNVTYAHAQSDPGKISVPVVAPFGAEFFITQTSGTSKVFNWCVTSA